MIRSLALLAAAALLAACSATEPRLTDRAAAAPSALPPMKTFRAQPVTRPARSNADIARDFMDLTFRLESGRALSRFTRFEEPITIRAIGDGTSNLSTDLDRLIQRIRREAGIDIRRVDPSASAGVTVEAVPQSQLQRAVPGAACFVVPRISSWAEFTRSRRASDLDWTTLERRERLAVFVPADAPPQEVRDCLHEEVAQALGPLNDLYRLTDSVFNDDNFHTVLTGFDMLILRATYAPDLRSGMSPEEVAARLPAILNRLNPGGAGKDPGPRPATTRPWIDSIEAALGPDGSSSRRKAAARRAVALARQEGWRDNRLAFSLFALGRLSLGSEPELALASFLQAGNIFSASPETAVHEAHVAMQLAAFALSAGQGRTAIEIVDRNAPAAMEAENAALLASLLMVKAEALDLEGHIADAREVRREALGWARYGFGDEAQIRRRAAEIAALNPLNRERLPS